MMRRVTSRRSPWSVRFMIRAGVVLLVMLATGVLMSDAGVKADESPNGIEVDGPERAAKRLPAARVIRLDERGWLEVTRPEGDRISSITVVTGFDCHPGEAVCDDLENGAFEEVTLHYRELVASGLDDVGTRRGLANALFLEGDLSGAIRAYSWAWAGFPSDSDLRNGLGNTLLALGVYEQARDEFAHLEQDPAYRAVALNNLGNALRAANEVTQAEEEYRRSAVLDSNLVAAHFNRGVSQMELSRFEAAAVSFREVIRRLPGLTEAYLHEGLALLRSGHAVRAAVALHRARDLEPDNPAVALALGLASQEVGLDGEAIALLERALAFNPADERIHHLLATSLVRTGQLGKAADVLQQAFDLRPRDADAYFQHGLKLFLCDRPQDSVHHLLQAMAKGRRDADLLFALGQALLQADRAEAAVQALQAASRMKPAAAEIHLALGLALQKTDDEPSAVREFKTASALDPADLDIQGVLMGALMRSSDFSGCAEVGKHLVEVRPELVAPRFDVALCLALAGDLEKAAEWLEDGLDHDLDGTEVHPLWRRVSYLVEIETSAAGPYLLLALIHQRRGNWSKAVEAYRGLIHSAPDTAWAIEAQARVHSLSPSAP